MRSKMDAHKKHWGRGVGKEIVKYMLKIAFEKLNLPEIRISVFSEKTLADRMNK